MPRHRRPVPAPTRFARASTWQPATRVERTLTRRRLPFTGDVRDLLRRAASLVAPRRPWRVWVSVWPRHASLNLDCGVDAHGVVTSVSITLHAADAWLLAYFARQGEVHGTVFVELPDDDGEDLTLPRVSVDELARMPATIGAA